MACLDSRAMRSQPVAIVNVGLVTSVGASALASCAAIRAGLTNPSETRFIAGGEEWLLGHQVLLEKAWRGRPKLVKMLARAVRECLTDEPTDGVVPVLLCVAERERPGRQDGLEDRLLPELEEELSFRFHPALSGVIPSGRVSAGVALAAAGRLLEEHGVSRVVIAAADSLLLGPTLSELDARGRLLTPRNSDGFIPGEAAGALLIAARPGNGRHLFCEGIGLANEEATIESGEPFRADGLSEAIRKALGDAGREMHDLDFRIADCSGEQYYFKEAALALSRTLRQRKERFDIWHPADCIGEVGAAAGAAMLSVALISSRKGYNPGSNILLQSSGDGGARAAVVLRYRNA
jgi:3-oxoacyl-[acyl-carrier-protein] synthase I